MSDRPDDPDIPLAPLPTTLPPSPFPPLQDEATPYLDDPEPSPTQPAEPPFTDPPSDWIQTADAHDLPTAPGPEPVNPLLALGRFAFPPGEPPDEEGLAARDRRWTSRVIVIATVFLLTFNIASVQNWVRQQEPGWVTTTVSRLSEVWSEQMALLGAERPREAVREAYENARDSDWRSGDSTTADGS
ncbi:hypothetical protein [Brevundimonas bacteroides]|uniref:hypothetical protein n=1 Tax=Brevundimonas bacteroides TaxID=74311 RepID=UPI0004969276|nr:hypothetical protein [Brevundimonas bacteroides]